MRFIVTSCLYFISLHGFPIFIYYTFLFFCVALSLALLYQSLSFLFFSLVYWNVTYIFSFFHSFLWACVYFISVTGLLLRFQLFVDLSFLSSFTVLNLVSYWICFTLALGDFFSCSLLRFTISWNIFKVITSSAAFITFWMGKNHWMRVTLNLRC